jgi:hypothetical protein
MSASDNTTTYAVWIVQKALEPFQDFEERRSIVERAGEFSDQYGDIEPQELAARVIGVAYTYTKGKSLEELFRLARLRQQEEDARR